MDTEKVLVSNKIYFGEIKTINTLLVTYIMIIKLPKTSSYLKSCDEQTKWMYFLLNMMTY